MSLLGGSQGGGTASAGGTNSPFAALHKSVGYRGLSAVRLAA